MPRPSVAEMHFVVWAFVLPFVFGDGLVSGDGDVARHIRLGQMILDQGSILRVDQWSWTKAGSEFLAFEWGTEVALALAYNVRGTVGVAVLAALVLATTFRLVCQFLLRRGVDPALAYVTVMLAALLSAGHWIARPHMFTFLGIALILPRLEVPKPSHVAMMAPLFVVWANMHGGFVFGLGLIGAYLTGDVLELINARFKARADTGGDWQRRALLHAGMLAVATPVTLINPNGIGLHKHVLSFFGLGTILEVTDEFRSPSLLSVTGILLALSVFAIVRTFFAARRARNGGPWRPEWQRTIVIISVLAMAIDAKRNMALFGLVALPMAALHIDPWWRELKDKGGFKASFARDHERGRAGPWTAAILSLLAVVTLIGGAKIIPTDFNEIAFPVDAVDAARDAELEGRMFNSLTWGGYMLLAWPEQEVFIDGGTDHYGDELVDEVIRIGTLQPGWQQTLDDQEIDMVMLPPLVQMVHELAATPEWDVWFCDETAALITRTGADTPVPVQSRSEQPAICPQA